MNTEASKRTSAEADRRLVVTMDGPAGSGKSSVARELARRLGVAFLDTGAMYRGLAAWCLEKGIDPARQQGKVVEALREIHMTFDWEKDPPALMVQGQSYMERIREPAVTAAVGHVASLPVVRKQMVQWQQEIGRAHGRLVTEGRDQGSVVFPDAQVKFYLMASPKVRAQRRALELQKAGQEVDFAQVLKDIVERDQRDMARADGPLVRPKDAIEVDTSELTFEEVVQRLHDLVRERLPEGRIAAIPAR